MPWSAQVEHAIGPDRSPPHLPSWTERSLVKASASLGSMPRSAATLVIARYINPLPMNGQTQARYGAPPPIS